jgi:hypothetical protein
MNGPERPSVCLSLDLILRTDRGGSPSVDCGVCCAPDSPPFLGRQDGAVFGILQNGHPIFAPYSSMVPHSRRFLPKLKGFTE